MSDLRMTVGELKEKLKDYPDDAVLVAFYDLMFWPFYKCYQVESHDNWRIVKHLNSLLGEKLTEDKIFILLK